MKQVSKRFPGTLAVDSIDFDVRVGEVHALMGENGAGKSTLMKILAGSFSDYTGEILIKGKSIFKEMISILKYTIMEKPVYLTQTKIDYKVDTKLMSRINLTQHKYTTTNIMILCHKY